MNIKTQSITLIVGILLGLSLMYLYTVNKVRVDCTTHYLTTFGNVNYICYYVGAPASTETVEQRNAYFVQTILQMNNH